MRSQHRTITQSLEQCGHSVDVLLALHSRSCANATLLERLTSWHRGLVRHIWKVSSESQALNVRAALNHFAPLAHRYDALILTRYDVLIKWPMHEWPGCQDDLTIGFSDQCEGLKWGVWNCTGDVIFVIPRALLWAFDAAVNAVPSKKAVTVYDHWDNRARRRVYGKIMTSACFLSANESSSRGFPVGLGHGCYNAVAERIGYDRLSLCWPGHADSAGAYPGLSEGNSTFYQCCTHGKGSLEHSLYDSSALTTVPL